MRNSELNRIATEMLTPEFVGRLYDAKQNMEYAALIRRPYGDEDLAADLELPLPIARILISFVGASNAEGEMTNILNQADAHRSESLQ